MSTNRRSAVNEKILVTGGTGYIGSHACVELLAAGREVVILDNLANSSAHVVSRIERIAGRRVTFVEGDVRDRGVLAALFERHPIGAAMHFAGLKAVGESAEKPLAYYDNNVQGSVVLAEAMAAHGVRTLVFSSSATVYGEAHAMPIREDCPLQPANTYGRTKLMVEQVLRDVAASQPGWRIALLRYFNPVGAHESGLIGEEPRGIPNNLLPYVSQVAAGRLERLSVFGSDYATPDGTGVRDYIHVMDLAQGHLAALRYLDGHEGVLTVNLGTGRGYSVLEMVSAFERASSRTVPLQVVARRPGDIAACYADPSLAAKLLGWRAQRDADAMCRDAWRWEQWRTANPQER